MSNAMLSLLGMYSWNDTLFDDMSFPESFTQEAKEVFVNNLLMECAELEVLYTDWNFEEITAQNIPEIIEFTKGFTFNSSEKDEDANKELELCCEVLENYDAFGMFGGALRVNGKIAGYSIGEIIGDTLFCHIEKADISYHGAYQMVTNQYLQMYAQGDDVKFVNREDDCGDEGLRKSKLSYHPVVLLEKIEFKVNL